MEVMITHKGRVVLEMGMPAPSARAAGISLLSAVRGRSYRVREEQEVFHFTTIDHY